MVLKGILLRRHNLLILLLLVLTANITLYHTAFGISTLPENSNGVVIGSMIDLALVSPLLYLVWKRKWHIKNMILAIATGLVLVRFLIPFEYLEPFVAITWVGFAVEGSLVLFEVGLLFLLAKHLPKIIHAVKQSPLPTIFSFSDAVDAQIKSTASIIKVICTEMLVFYYAFGCWKSKPVVKENPFTMHKNSSLVAPYIMLIHSILLETIAIHWWLHAKFPITSIILLMLNIYSVVFLIGNLQSIRHNPLHITEDEMYLSFGLMKRMKINYANIEEIIDDPEVLQRKLSKGTIDFIARDFEKVSPHVILKLKEPAKAIFLLGIEKRFQYIAIRLDEPNKFREAISSKIDHA